MVGVADGSTPHEWSGSRNGLLPEALDHLRPRQEILLAFDRLADEEPLTTAEVAAELPIGRRALQDRLERMHRDGDLGTKDFGNRVGWWAALAPELDPGLKDELDETADERQYRSMEELDDRLDERRRC